MATVTLSVTDEATDSPSGTEDSATFAISNRATDGQVGVAYSFTYTTNMPDGTLTWAESGELAEYGLSLNTSTGEISGTPTISGTSVFGITVSGDTSSDAISDGIAVAAAAWTITNTAPGGTEDSFYTHTYTTDGAAAPTVWSVTSGALPDGVTLTDAAAGTISGTPTVPGTFNWVIQCVDDDSVTVSQDEGNKVINSAAPAAPTGFTAVRV